MRGSPSQTFSFPQAHTPPHTHSPTHAPPPDPAADVEVDGGDPLSLRGPLLLCGRYGGAASRAYGGQLAQLSVYDTALSAVQVEQLYNMVRGGGGLGGREGGGRG